MPYICSTATNDAYYCDYAPGGADLPVLKHRVLIKGGANRGGKNLQTPQGVVTEVSQDDLDFLNKNTAFQRHVKKGFLTVVEQKKEPEANKVAKDMTKQDASAPLRDVDYEDGGRMANKAVPGTKLDSASSVGKVKAKKGNAE